MDSHYQNNIVEVEFVEFSLYFFILSILEHKKTIEINLNIFNLCNLCLFPLLKYIMKSLAIILSSLPYSSIIQLFNGFIAFNFLYAYASLHFPVLPSCDFIRKNSKTYVRYAGLIGLSLLTLDGFYALYRFVR